MEGRGRPAGTTEAALMLGVSARVWLTARRGEAWSPGRVTARACFVGDPEQGLKGRRGLHHFARVPAWPELLAELLRGPGRCWVLFRLPSRPHGVSDSTLSLQVRARMLRQLPNPHRCGCQSWGQACVSITDVFFFN